MVLRLVVFLYASCGACAAASLLASPLALRASPHRRPRARQLVANEMGMFDLFKERMTQMADLRIARASHILVRGNDTATLDRLAEWKREIGNDEEIFAQIASEHSTCPSRTRGGDLGYFARGKMARPPASMRRHRAPHHYGAFGLGRLWMRCGACEASVVHAAPTRCRTQVMEFDKVVFNEEPGAVYGPGAKPTP